MKAGKSNEMDSLRCNYYKSKYSTSINPIKVKRICETIGNQLQKAEIM